MFGADVSSLPTRIEREQLCRFDVRLDKVRGERLLSDSRLAKARMTSVFRISRLFLVIRRIVETVSNPRFGQYVFGLRRIVFDLLPKRSNVRSQVFELLAILRTPHRTEQFSVRQ